MSQQISGFRCEIDENCLILSYYAASSGRFLLTFRDNLPVPSSRVKPFKIEPIVCPEMSVRNYHYSLRNDTEEHIAEIGEDINHYNLNVAWDCVSHFLCYI
jgi:hypothetical protein